MAVRVRPLLQGERDMGVEPALTVVGRQELKDAAERMYLYDRVFDSDVSTQEVFETLAEDIVLSSLEGFSGCIFCYGHTGSGKTYTMHGNRGKNPGLVPLSVETIFAFIEEAGEKEFLIRCGYLEIYNESINDLLNAEATNLALREDPARGVSVQGLTETVCSSVEHIYSLLNLGDSNKQFAATKLNSRSSRSHTILQLTIETKEKHSHRNVTLASLNLIDLAGSESANAHIASTAAGSRQREMKCINRSLLTLSTVIQRLSEETKSHVPYRDSKLTRLLKPALEGKAKVCVICNVSSNPAFMDETVNTLKFAQRAKKVTQVLQPTEILDSSSVLLLQYESEIKRLQGRLQELESQIEAVPPKEKVTEELQKLGKQLQDRDAEVETLMEEKMAMQAQLERYRNAVLDSESVKMKKVQTDVKWDVMRHGRQSIRMREILRGGRDSLEPSLLADLDKVPEILNAENPIDRISIPFAVASARQSLDLGQVIREKDDRIVSLEVELKAKSEEVDALNDALQMCRNTIARLQAENRVLKTAHK